LGAVYRAVALTVATREILGCYIPGLDNLLERYQLPLLLGQSYRLRYTPTYGEMDGRRHQFIVWIIVGCLEEASLG